MHNGHRGVWCDVRDSHHASPKIDAAVCSSMKYMPGIIRTSQTPTIDQSITCWYFGPLLQKSTKMIRSSVERVEEHCSDQTDLEEVDDGVLVRGDHRVVCIG